jgi:hypothetical protein
VSPREAVACWAGGVASCASYTLQRLWSAWGTEVDPTQILAVEHIPYYWRCALAALHGLLFAGLVAGGIRDPEAAKLLAWAPSLTWLVVLPCVVAMVLVP